MFITASCLNDFVAVVHISPIISLLVYVEGANKVYNQYIV